MWRASVLLICLTPMAYGQQIPADRPKLEIRYGVSFREDAQFTYSQKTPKDTVISAIGLIESKRFELFVAHFLDPKHIDDKVTSRIQLLEPSVEKYLLEKRDWQRVNFKQVLVSERLPDDPAPFAAAVRTETFKVAFQQVVREIQDHIDESPEIIRHFQRFLRNDDFIINGDVAQTSVPELPGKTLFFRKVGARWFLENKQVDTPKTDGK